MGRTATPTSRRAASSRSSHQPTAAIPGSGRSSPTLRRTAPGTGDLDALSRRPGGVEILKTVEPAAEDHDAALLFGEATRVLVGVTCLLEPPGGGKRLTERDTRFDLVHDRIRCVA